MSKKFKNSKKIIANWKKSTQELAEVFTEKYYPDDRDMRYCFWVADEIGGVFSVSDRYFNVDRMLEALENNATYEQLEEYGDVELEAAMKGATGGLRINFKNFIRYGWMDSPPPD